MRKYLAKEDLSAVPSSGKPRASAVGPVSARGRAVARGGSRELAQAAAYRDQDLGAVGGGGHGMVVSLSTVTRAVARPGRGFAAERDEAFMDLVWHPGEAQADFGEVDVLLRGVVQRMHHFVPGFPYSNVGLVQSVPGGNAECTCLALRNLFEWLGGVPERIVFDNAAGMGHKGHGEREPRPTAPVPGLPGALRVRLLVGQPVFRPREGRGGVQGRVWCGASCSCPGRAYGAWRTSAPGCRTGAWSWTRNRTAARTRRNVVCSPRTVRRCCRCPGSVSTSAAWRHMKADRYGAAAPGDGIAVPRTGRTRAESRSWASARSRPGVLDSSGKHLATHPRAYGQASTNSEDPSMQLALLCNKPASWPDSRVRDALPDPLRQWLDRQDR